MATAPCGVRTTRTSSRFGRGVRQATQLRSGSRARRGWPGPTGRRRAYDATSSDGLLAAPLRGRRCSGGGVGRCLLGGAPAGLRVRSRRARGSSIRRPAASRGSAATSARLRRRFGDAAPGPRRPRRLGRPRARLAARPRARARLRGRRSLRRDDVAADVDPPAGQAGGQPGVLPLAADGQREHPLGHRDVGDPVLLVDHRRPAPAPATGRWPRRPTRRRSRG